MLVFIVPLKSKRISRNWALTCRLFERSLRSMCNQTSEKFRVVVVCNERPEIAFCHPHVHFLEVDFPPPLLDPTEPASRGYDYSRSQEIARKNADKAKKILAGIDYAKCFDPTHCMVVDADDCVSCQLAEFVEKQPQVHGWYCKQGYFYSEGSRFLFLNRQNFNVICGSSVLFPYERWDTMFADRDLYKHAFCDPPAEFVPLPFVGVVYSMANGDNIYMSADTRNEIYGSLLKRVFSKQIVAVAWKAINYWPTLLTENKRREFGLYTLQEEPTPKTRALETPIAR